MISSDVVFRTSPDLVLRDIGEEVVGVPVRLGDGEHACLYTFNEVGSLILSGVRAGETFSQIIDRVAAEYSVPRAQAAEDAFEFLSGLESDGLVQREPSVGG